MTQRSRVQFIDSARGAAMLFVLLSHFGFTFFPDQRATLPTAMRIIGMVASPTFVLLNGLMIGLLYRVRAPQDFSRLRVIFVDRGLFLLTVGHLLLLGSHAPAYTLRFFSITDTIGICLIATPFLTTAVSSRARVAIGSASYVLTGLALKLWQPHTELGLIFKETTVGSMAPVVYAYAFPILPWFALNCLGSALGQWLGGLQNAGDHRGIKRVLAAAASLAMTGAISLNAAYLGLKHSRIPIRWLRQLRVLVTPFQKMPPGPGYLLWYGGLGLLIILGCLVLETGGLADRLLKRLAHVGEASLFVFVLQFYVYLAVVLPLNTRLPFPALWPLYLVISMGIVLAAAVRWQSMGANRYLTVGYQWLRARQESAHGLEPDLPSGQYHTGQP